ncbi:ABC-F type ribosomal protection protein [Clostridium sp. AL.422]|uniref:ABC-F type ribosomal protection protein CplR n=1 Tax=Clostridium TaxID=1485 RepID=UPI00293DE915|nr:MULTISPECIES: ABC-F type ribosomal protection protein CplR [unclassified Clostridium]MDV4151067.1 ABC-F type ribosomal protection protein [Clostridium sp. AL.422]
MQLALLNNVKKYYGDRLILDIKKLEILKGDRIGLVGVNGAGKSTLLKILIGEEEADSGSVYLTKSFSYISQIENYEEDSSISKVTSLFNAPKEYKDYLSGGEKVKLKISNALSENKELIIADEPTSNLDSNSIETLEKMFRSHTGSFILVSHDRNFLDALCNTIIEIDDGKINLYKGNYTKYLELKALEKTRQNDEYNKYINEKRRLEEAMVVKEKLKNAIRRTPKRMGNSEARLHKMGGQKAKKHLDNTIKAINSRIEHLEVKEKPKDEKQIKINVIESLELTSKNPIEVKNLNLIVKDKTLLSNADFKIKKGKKVALIGKNGSGKSTLLKELIKNNNESIKISNNVVFGFLDQEQNILNPDKTILENIQVNSSYQESFIRINLDGFGFKGDAVYKKVSNLSGGEKVKVAICKLLLSDNNFVILDEPTNYLDIKCMESLENALKNTDKTLLIVSHDRKFISNICNYILEIDNNKVYQFDGSYDEYVNFKSKPKEDKTEKIIKENKLILENKLSEVISLLSFENDLGKKDQLEKEYHSLLNKLKALR